MIIYYRQAADKSTKNRPLETDTLVSLSLEGRGSG
jgi:hypothetical protein